MTRKLSHLTQFPIADISDNDKDIYLKTLAHLAQLDGNLDNEEIDYIKDIAKSFDINISDALFTPYDEAQILDRLKHLGNRRICLELIKDLCFLGHADSNLSDDEVLFIGHAGKAMNIEIEKIEQISDWIVNYIIWQETGKVIFEDC